MNFKPILKSIIPHIIAIVVMLIVSSIYFSPAWQGKTLQRDDIVKGYGGNRDKKHAKKYEGKDILWSDAKFCGMPSTMGVTSKSTRLLKNIYNFPRKIGIPMEVASLAWYMLSLYILLIALGVNPWLALIGSVSFGLTSYNLIILNAGHFKKVRTLAFIAPVLAGFLLSYREKYIAGFTLIAFFLAQQIAHDHIQMSYYLFLGLICIGFVELYYHVKEKQLKKFGRSTLVILVAALLAIAPNYPKLTGLYKYNNQSIRGKNELTVGKEKNKTKSGLDRDYINQWSSSRAETMMLFAPNVKGGKSAPIKDDRELLMDIEPRFRKALEGRNQYWGNQPSTGGPNSAGAVIVFLFILGAFIVKGPLKKGIVISVILFILLSMGRHFPMLSNLFIDYMPLYNKFRVPVSILAVGVIFICFFAFYTISKIISEPEILQLKSRLKIGKNSLPLYLVAGMGFIAFLLLNIAFPTLFNTYISDKEIELFAKYRAEGSVERVETIMSVLEGLRIRVFRMEFLRALLFSAGTLFTIILYKKEKINKYFLIALIGILSISEVWSISLRYVDKDDFTDKNLVEEEYRLTDIDKQIYAYEVKRNPRLKQLIEDAYNKFQPKTDAEKEDIEKYIINKYTFYRVYNLTMMPFQENVTSGSHNSIGGYSAAKLRRYQDLIEHHIAKGEKAVLDMLNARYIVTKNGLRINRGAMGPAWFVNEIVWASSPDEEIKLLDSVKVKKQIIVNDKFRDKIRSFETSSKRDKIRLRAGDPDHLVYKTSTEGDRLVVFSEIYYPDWTVLIDGKPSEYFEANYVLRAMVIPKGEHKVEFIFRPDYLTNTNALSLVFYYILILLVISVLGFHIFKSIKADKMTD